MTGFEVRRNCSSINALKSSSTAIVRRGLPSSSHAFIFSRRSTSTAYFLSAFCIEIALGRRLSIASISAKISSRLIVSISRRGLTLPSTWVIFSSSKHLTTWTIASTSRMCERNLLPRPSPLLAPLTRPAMSTNSRVVGVIFLLS